MKTTRTRRGRVSGVAVIAGFILLCGLILVFAPPGGEAGEAGEVEKAAADRVHEALREVRRAQGALTEANYGDVRKRLERADRALTGAHAQLKGPSDRSD